jgi:hypothetical protein
VLGHSFIAHHHEEEITSQHHDNHEDEDEPFAIAFTHFQHTNSIAVVSQPSFTISQTTVKEVVLSAAASITAGEIQLPPLLHHTMHTAAISNGENLSNVLRGPPVLLG